MKKQYIEIVKTGSLSLASAIAVSAFSVSCGDKTSSAGLDAAKPWPLSAEAYATARKERLKEAKDAILAFATVATERRMESEVTIPKSRLRMAELIRNLQKLAPSSTFEQRFQKTIGVWQEVWSDEQNPLPPGFKILRPQVFQVIRADGIGFNIGVRATPFGIGTAFIKLRASADAEKQRTNVEFLKTYSKVGDLATEPSLPALVQDILDNTRADITELPDSPFPRGPIGAKGTLDTVYVDDELRIVRGPNSYSDVVDTFILKRIEE